MSLEIGDKVVVFNAGTDYARATKIEPIEVGDTVTVVELSDGTKLPLPRLKIDISDYVFVIPVWDDSFDINGPYTYEMLPLGMCVFTVTDVKCLYLEDIQREWEDGELVGFYFINMSLLQRIRNKGNYPEMYPDGDLLAINCWVVTYNSENRYIIERENQLLPPRDCGFSMGNLYWTPTPGFINPNIDGTLNISNVWGIAEISQLCNLSGAASFSFKIKVVSEFYGSSPYFVFNFQGILHSDSVAFYLYQKLEQRIDGRWYNHSYPDSDIFTASLWSVYPDDECNLIIRLETAQYGVGRHTTDYEIDDLTFYDVDGNVFDTPCIMGQQIGDRYVIYDPVNKKLIANDSAKTALAAANWRAVVTPGEEITLAVVEYAWDGAGYVYLTSSKTTFAQIAYHTQIQITATAAGETKVIDWHTGAAFSYDGLTISSEMTHITSILRPGKNTITVSVRDVSSAKIGFAAPVYIRRNMAALH